MEGSCSTSQSPQWAVVPVEEEEEEGEEERKTEEEEERRRRRRISALKCLGDIRK
jgi:hypothetical protein